MRRIITPFLATVAAVLMMSVSCSKKTEPAPVPFIGTNMWYASALAVSDPDRLGAELDSLCAHGLTNVRILATDENFEAMDAALDAIAARKMKAVLFLNNAWEWSEDGYRSWLEKAGAGNQPHPAVDGYVAYMNAMSAFASNADAVALYQEHVRKVVDRYKDSDAVWSWQICNEPRPFSESAEDVDAFVKYIESTAALIKSLDPLHLVSTGNEGAMGCNEDYELTERLNSCVDIDYVTVHIWPYNWSWIDAADVKGGVDAAIEKTELYIDRHIEMCRRLGKPMVIEEFGYPRDGFLYGADVPTAGRDRYYSYVFSRVLESAREADVLLGCNFWAWNGLARPAHDFWQEGDDLCGDPPQEAQGLNGVFISDSSTLAVIDAYVDSLLNVAIISNPASDAWLMEGDGPYTLPIKVSGGKKKFNLDIKIIRDTDMMDPEAEPLMEKSVKCRVRPGYYTEVNLPLGALEPGFYSVSISGNKSFNIGVNPDQVVSPSDAPEDFEEFWQSTLAELSQIPMTVTMTPVPEHSSAQRECYTISIPSLGGELMGGIIYIPTGDGVYPVYMEFMGYGADCYWQDPSGTPDRIDYLVSVRDQGIFKENNSEWIDRGLNSRDEFYYRGAFCDIVRAVDFVSSLPKADTSRIFGYGDSQGGAFTWISAALTGKMRAIAPSVPFLGDYPDYAKIVWWPMHEMFQHADAEGVERDSLMSMLRYFDVKNFAGKVNCPLLMAFGLQDSTCPPHTNMAAYNNAATDNKNWFCVPWCGHSMWAEPSWNTKRQEFFDTF